MKYIKILDEQNRIYPYSDRQFRRDNFNTSFPSTISDETKALYGVYPVIDEPLPVYNESTQNIIRESPSLVDNQWTVKWVVVDKTEEEKIQYRENQIRKVKAEANRRILAIAPEWQQRNMIARSVELLSIVKDNWSNEEKEEVANIEKVWQLIKQIRLKSNEIETMNPIPEDYKDDKYWL